MSDLQVLPRVLPSIHPGLEIVEFDGATVVFDDRSRQAHQLVWATAVVFEGCRAGLTTERLLSELIDAGVGDRGRVTDIIMQSLAGFEAQGLLEGGVAPPPCLGCGQAPLPPRRRRFAKL